MATQLNSLGTAHSVFRGTRHEIEEQLKQINETDSLTLIVETQPQKLGLQRTFEEILAPTLSGTDESGMTDDELAVFLEAEVKAYRYENNRTL